MKTKPAEILIVEDSLMYRKIIEDTLKKSGYNSLVFAENGKDALDYLEKHNPKLVITDIVMPEMDGYSLCRYIKENRNLKNIPVIIVTLLEDPEDVIKGLECGSDYFVTKPYEEEHLSGLIKNILEERQRHKAKVDGNNMKILFRNRSYTISIRPKQILTLLLSIYETSVKKNNSLKNAEGELQKSRDQLEIRVKERTAELNSVNERLQEEIKEHRRVSEINKKIQAQLIQSQKMEAVGTLAAGVAHEVNNPLGVIRLSIDSLLVKLKGDKPVEKKLKTIQDETKRAGTIIQSLLTFSRKQDNGKKTITNINDLIKKTLNTIEHQLDLNGVKTKKMLSKSLPKINVSYNQIQQVILNLINNARDAMPEGGMITIKTKTDITENNKKIIALEISDTGCGMTDQTKEKIFDPFFTTKQETKGTGLGLSVSYGIILSHNGDIQVKSKINQGTTFIIRLPLTVP